MWNAIRNNWKADRRELMNRAPPPAPDVKQTPGYFPRRLKKWDHKSDDHITNAILPERRPEQTGKLIVERDGEILRCPWHGWEFDILTGKSIVNPNRIRTKSYKACLEDPLNSGSLGCGVEKLESLETYVTKIEGRELVVYL